MLGWRDTPVDGIRHRPRGARIAALYRADFHRLRGRVLTKTSSSASSTWSASAPKIEIAAADMEDAAIFYIPSLSCRTIVYKGLLLAPQIANFYGELSDPDVNSALCLVHQRFSTNTFPSWQLRASVSLHRAQRRNQYRARQRELDARAPVDAGVAAIRRRFEEAVSHHRAGGQRFRQLRQRGGTAAPGGAQLPHVMAMLIPEAWAGNPHMDPEKRAFYEYHAR